MVPALMYRRPGRRARRGVRICSPAPAQAGRRASPRPASAGAAGREQSRSPRCTPLPYASQSTCTSTWRARGTYRSRYTRRRRNTAGRRPGSAANAAPGPPVRHDADAAPATAGRGLDHHRVADVVGDPPAVVDGAPPGRRRRAAPAARRRPSAPRAAPCRRGPHDLRRRADEREPVVCADLGEIGVLGQEPVAGVDRLGAGGARPRRWRAR